MLFGLLCSPVRIWFGISLRTNDWGVASGDGYGLGFINSAGIAAFLAPCFIWYIIIERRKRISSSKGVVVGLLGAALAHVICWYLFLLSSYIEQFYLGVLTEKSLGPLEGILAALTYSLISLPLFGLLTLPFGGLISGICGKIFKIKGEKTTSP